MTKAQKIKDILARLLKSHNSPPEIALGVAIGVFIAIMPIYGLHTILVILLALVIRRANKVAMLLGTSVSIPPTMPLITWVAYKIGKLILQKDYPLLNSAYFSHIHLADIKKLYYPLFIGSLALGLVCALIAYFITLLVFKRIRRKQNNAKE